MAARIKIKVFFALACIALLGVACASSARPASVPLPPFAANESAKGGMEAPAMDMAVAPQAPAAPMPEGAAEESLEAGDGGERMVIKNVDLSLIVIDPVTRMDEIGRLAEEMGGFVVVSNRYQTTTPSGAEVPQGSITVRVPAERLNEALEKIKAGAEEVKSENVSGQDVTQEYTDLQSRLRNLEAAEAELRKIMEEAYSTEDVMNVYNQLVQIREQIEVVKGQMKYYETSTSLSAVRIELIAKASIEPLTVAGWEPAGEARDAVQALINAFKFLINLSIWLLLFLIPLLIVIALPIWFVIWLIRRIYRKRKAASAARMATEGTPAPGPAARLPGEDKKKD